MQHDDLVYLAEMYDFAVGIAQRANGLERASFDADEDLRLAIVQLLGWLGEAARRRDAGAGPADNSVEATTRGYDVVQDGSAVTSKRSGAWMTSKRKPAVGKARDGDAGGR